MRLPLKFKTIAALLAVVVLVGTAVFLVWASNLFEPMAEAALPSHESTTVAIDPWITFYPPETAVETDLILYTSARVRDAEIGG